MGAPRHHRFLPTALTAVLITVLAACGGAAEQRASRAMAASEEVTFTTSDGVRLAGRVFGPPEGTIGGDAGLVLAHMLPADQSSWFDEAIRLAQQGYLVLTFNLRGACPGGAAGCSQGEASPASAPVDLAAAVEHMRTQLAVRRLGVIGASIGGTAALAVAADDPGVSAVVTLSAPRTVAGLSVAPETVARVEAAVLLIAGTGDGSAAADAEAFYNEAGQPKRLEVLPSDDHGTDMLLGNAAGRVRDHVDSWLITHLAPEAPEEGAAA